MQTSSNTNQDNHILKISIFGGVLFSVLGIIWGIIANSQMIIFDGLYSFVSLGLSFLSLFAYSFTQKVDTERFHFGKGIIEPLVIMFKASAIIAMCLFALSSAVIDLFKGGREVALGQAAIYALIATGLCILFYWSMKRKEGSSEFVKAEAAQWLMDTLLSAAVLVGFVIALILHASPFAYITPYIDPFMVLAVSVYFLKVPAQMFVRNAKEILMMAPPGNIQTHVEKVVQQIKDKYRIEESFVRISKVGKTVFIEIDFVLNEKTVVQTVDEFDTVREEMDRNLQLDGYDEWLTLSFTKDRKWAL
ncbi:cation diffusion facilitator family transporter [Alteribacillus iranensis]|uniref:Cation diffusion facilitator family transporter n=1 Tax=Alteribacillus iranensis TaxID=930128 RepID=A0A1I2B580_9BACI|nr:cation diffusion facilitator family transporter [Alteribacillus iranensis]SFE51236.1 cation diffusion facilitator family transporter [Alteribacillus iranensis]